MQLLVFKTGFTAEITLLEDCLEAELQNLSLSNWKMPFSLQDASVIAIEKCFLMHCSNTDIRQTHFMLCVFLTSFNLL